MTGRAVKAESGGSVDEPNKEPESVRQEPRTCPICGTKFYATADSGFCPVCILERAQLIIMKLRRTLSSLGREEGHFHAEPRQNKAMNTSTTSNWRPLLRALSALLIAIAALWAMPRNAWRVAMAA
jgi:hypothetical protein